MSRSEMDVAKLWHEQKDGDKQPEFSLQSHNFSTVEIEENEHVLVLDFSGAPKKKERTGYVSLYS